ncbi:hypothetical protein Pla100_14450 [Neorhodopirellula pilleata]|uniref:Uncharacterized protein n=1 Tax=Neorhodopirellula pilleata TaxID=2714738 RepID=A0A5C6APS9_9BACT|nr:hypothetical protein Pla100_14450 [Neorhodopirellula pilleata]
MIAPMKMSHDTVPRHRQPDMEPTRMDLGEIGSSHVAKPTGDRIFNVVGKYPIVAVAASAIVGVALGWLVKRKWNG